MQEGRAKDASVSAAAEGQIRVKSGRCHLAGSPHKANIRDNTAVE